VWLALAGGVGLQINSRRISQERCRINSQKRGIELPS
jgi:hypothetical protein